MATSPSAELLVLLLDHLRVCEVDGPLGSIKLEPSYGISTVAFLQTVLLNAPYRKSLAKTVWEVIFSGHPPPAQAAWLPVDLQEAYPWENADHDMIRVLATAIVSEAAILQKLEQWSQDFFTYFITPFRTRIFQPSRETQEMTAVEDAMSELLYKRDGYRCLASHTYERRHRQNTEARAEVAFATLKVVHILPPMCSNRPTVHRYLEMFSGNNIPANTLTDENINSLSNTFLLQSTWRIAFYSFVWGIQCNEDPQTGSWTYHVVMLGDNRAHTSSSQCVAFGAFQQERNSNDHHPLPNPHLLNVHCAIGRILHSTQMSNIFPRLDKGCIDRKGREWLDGSNAMIWLMDFKLAMAVDTQDQNEKRGFYKCYDGEEEEDDAPQEQSVALLEEIYQ